MGKFYIYSGTYKTVKNAISVEAALHLAAKDMIGKEDSLGELITINEHGDGGPREDDLFFLTEHFLSKIE